MNNFRKLLVHYVIMDDYSFLNIKSKDFCNLFYLLCKDAFILSADIIKKKIIITFNNNLQKMCQILQISLLLTPECLQIQYPFWILRLIGFQMNGN